MIDIFKNVIVFSITFITLTLFFHFFRFPSVIGESMEPTYYDDERIMVLYTSTLQRNDVAIIWSDDLNEYLIKRVIGCEGDHIEIKDGKLYRNGINLYETYIKEQDWSKDGYICDIVVPENEYFVMGDNRNNSADSRMFGTFKKSEVYGKVLFKIPF